MALALAAWPPKLTAYPIRRHILDPIESANVRLVNAGITIPLKAKWQSLIVELASFHSAVIAFSGGVDSSFLAYAASQVLGNHMVAVTVVSPVEPANILNGAIRFAAQHGFRHDTISHDPLQNPMFQANPPDRCYHCKTSILNDLWSYARNHHYSVVLEGQNADDGSDYRPGRKAVAETGTFSPLAHNELTKAEIRWLSKAFELSIWNQPSSPCLASRIPYGTAITEKALDQVARAENYLHERGFKIVRVRYHNDLARIEIESDQVQTLLEMRKDLVSYFKQIGFLYITLDLQGYRQGSMNEGLSL
jgi:uncharacterized protein